MFNHIINKLLPNIYIYIYMDRSSLKILTSLQGRPPVVPAVLCRILRQEVSLQKWQQSMLKMSVSHFEPWGVFH